MELSQQASVPLSAPTVDSLLNGSNVDPTMSAAFGSGSQNQFDSEKQQRKQQVLARREELRQKAVGGDDASAPLAAPPAQQTPLYTQTPTQSAAPAGLRDDLIRGAVDFLTHPRVAGSDPEKKRRFLKSKGLTDEEINESFKRAGSLAGATPAASAPMPYAAPAPQGGQQMIPQQYQQPRPYGAVMPPPPPPPQIVVQSPSLRALAFIVLICAGIGSAITYLIRRYVIPYFWPRKKPQEEKLEKLQQEIAATSAVVQEQAEDIRDALSIIKNFLQSQIDSSVDTKSLEEARQRQESAKVSELKREIGAIKNLLPVSAFAPSWKRNTTGPHLGSEFLEDFYDIKGEITDIKRALGNSRPASEGAAATTTSTTTATPAAAPAAPGSAPVERAGSKRGLPAWMQAQPTSIPSWQLTDGQSETGTSSPPLSTTPPQSTTPPRSTTPPPPAVAPEQSTNASATGGEPPMSQDFMNILQMVQAGKTPPNVRTDIDDTPADPNAPISAGQVAPRPKPWQKRGLPEEAAASDLYQQPPRSNVTSN